MKTEGYYVIGGQYEAICYGWKPTLHAAKLLAAKNEEYWDNWQGWNRPAIYDAKNCEMRKTMYRDYETIVPKGDVYPALKWTGKRWDAIWWR